ncbi:MAG: hypothetical protein ACOCYO_09785 [Bacteroidota bacterium]
MRCKTEKDLSDLFGCSALGCVRYIFLSIWHTSGVLFLKPEKFTKLTKADPQVCHNDLAECPVIKPVKRSGQKIFSCHSAGWKYYVAGKVEVEVEGKVIIVNEIL